MMKYCLICGNAPSRCHRSLGKASPEQEQRSGLRMSERLKVEVEEVIQNYEQRHQTAEGGA